MGFSWWRIVFVVGGVVRSEMKRFGINGDMNVCCCFFVP